MLQKSFKENFKAKCLPYINLVFKSNIGKDFELEIQNLGNGPAISLKILNCKNNEPILEYMNLGKDKANNVILCIKDAEEENKYKILFEDLTGNHYEQVLTYYVDKPTYNKFIVTSPKLINSNSKK